MRLSTYIAVFPLVLRKMRPPWPSIEPAPLGARHLNDYDNAEGKVCYCLCKFAYMSVRNMHGTHWVYENLAQHAAAELYQRLVY